MIEDENEPNEGDFDAERRRDVEGRDEIERQSVRRDRWDRKSAEKLWLVSYSDFMTIMMIFFLAMFGYSHMVEAKKEKARAPLEYPEFTRIVQDMQHKMGDQVRVLDEVSKVTVELGQDVLFKSGSADLNEESRATLQGLASELARLDGDIIVEGHTDDVPIQSKRYRSNWELSAARAFSVVNQFTAAGIPPTRLAAWGFGENRPVAANDTEENRERNRRIAIIVLKKKTAGKIEL